MIVKRVPPVEFVRCGAVSLPIRHDPVTMMVRDPKGPRREGEPVPMIRKTYESFYVDARSAGRGRIRAATLAEARKKGKPIVKELAKEGECSVQLPPADRRIYLMAQKALAPHNLTVDEGARQLAGMLQRLNGAPFEKVLQTYEASKQKLILGAKTPEIYELYLYDHEVIRGNGEYHVRDVERFVGGFVKAFPGEIIPITTLEIDGWLKARGGKSRSKNNARNLIIAFFNFAQQKGYLPQDCEHAALGTSVFRDSRKKITTEEEALENISDIEFYLPDEMRRILAVAPIHVRPSLELKGFTGIRTEEVFRFWWVFIDEVGNVIKIPKEIAKLKCRILPIMANLQRRLAAYDADFKRGRVCKDWSTANSLYHAWERTCREAGVRYKKNAFRDCYITYRLAMTNDPKVVAMESGNSERMIREHYLHLATKAQAEEWFSL